MSAAASTGLVVGAAALLALGHKRAAPGTHDASQNDPDDLWGKSRDELETAALLYAARRGVANPTTLLAIIDTESQWDQTAINHGAGDESRGGAWGLAQLTLTTARAQDDETPSKWAWLDPLRPGDVLVWRPDVCLDLAAAFVAKLERASVASGDGTPEDVAGRYNGGSGWRLKTTTFRDYVPRFLRNYGQRINDSGEV